MIKYIFYRRYDLLLLLENNKSFEMVDNLIHFIDSEIGYYNYKTWIEILRNAKILTIDGKTMTVNKKNSKAFISSQFNNEKISNAYPIEIDKLITIIKEWSQLKADCKWDIITVNYTDDNISFHGSMLPKNRTIIFYRGLEEDRPQFYNAINPVMGIINELRSFLAYEIQVDPQDWITFLENPKLEYRDDKRSNLEKCENNLVLISNFSHKVRTEQNIEAFAIDRLVLLDLTRKWIELTKLGYKKIVLEVKDGVYSLEGQF